MSLTGSEVWVIAELLSMPFKLNLRGVEAFNRGRGIPTYTSTDLNLLKGLYSILKDYKK